MTKKADLDFAESEMCNVEYEMPPAATVDNSTENDFSVTLSRSLAKQLHNLAKYEGIHSVDLLLELVTEGIARRIMEDQTRPAPSHLMTRNGYVVDQQHTQPSMSHHAFQSNGNVRDGQNNSRGKNNFVKNSSSSRQNNNTRYNNRNSSMHGYNNGNSGNSGNSGNTGSYFKSPKKSEF